MMIPLNRVVCGDALEVLKKMPDECIDMVLTSPPYWGLRDYRVKGQLGLEHNPEEYIHRVVAVFDQVKRVLKKTGSLYLNLGDTYCGSGSGGSDKKARTVAGSSTRMHGKPYPQGKVRCNGGWLRPKQLLFLPPRIVALMQDRGWLLRNTIIWHKPNPMPSSVKDRLANTWEYLFFFAKSRRYYFDLDAIRVPHKTGPAKFNYRAHNVPELSEPNAFHPREKNPGDTAHFDDDYWFNFIKGAAHVNWKHKLAFETMKRWMVEKSCQDYGKFYEWYKKQKKGNWKSGNLTQGRANYLRSTLPFPNPGGTNPGDILHVRTDTRRKNRGVAELRRDGTWGDDHPSKNPQRWFAVGGKNPGDFWTINTRPFKGAHFAVFPEDLCVMPIKATCPRWICKKCGKPRERITRPTKEYARLLKKSWTEDTDRDKNLRMKIGFRAHTKQVSCTAQYETVGWSDCGCNAGFEPGIVLDPFAGSGTVGAVAKRLGRNYILIDINPDYRKLARKRLREVS
jgi:DNA modification methylase